MKKDDKSQNKKKKILIIFGIVIFIVMIIFGINYFRNKNLNDSDKFAKEYNLVDTDGKLQKNVFVYKNGLEIINILKHGTGLVYLGFPECPWCGEYVKHLNEVAMENGVDKIYYKNVLGDRITKNRTYKYILKKLNKQLQYDEEGNKKLYVPALIAVKNGKIVGFNDETAWDTKGYKTAKEYWEHEDLDGLKQKFKKMIDDTARNVCVSGCNK